MYSHPYLYDWIRADHERRVAQLSAARSYDVLRTNRRLTRRAGGSRFSLRTAVTRPRPVEGCATC